MKKVTRKPSGCRVNGFLDCETKRSNPEKNHLCSFCKAEWPEGMVVNSGQFHGEVLSAFRSDHQAARA